MPTIVSVKNLPEVNVRPDLEVSNFPKRFVEFFRMRNQVWNPFSRTDRNKPRFKELKRSIRDNGIISPLVLTSDLVKIDGHCRSASGQDLGMVGATCYIAPFDSTDPRAGELYKLLNTTTPMPGRQLTEIASKGGPDIRGGGKTWREAVKSLGADGYHITLFKARGCVPQLWQNCKKVADLAFNNGIVKDRPAREALVHRAVMKWQCHTEGLGRQAALKRYCTNIANGRPGYAAKALWKAIENDQDIED